MQLLDFERQNLEHHTLAAGIWNMACGDDLAIDASFVTFNTLPTPGVAQQGQFVMLEGQPVGFILASAVTGQDDIDTGWIDAVAVSPAFQRRGCGTALFEWAEEWLWELGCTRARLGGSLRPFTPGLPAELKAGQPFFTQRGYEHTTTDWDVARDLARYPDDLARPTGAILRPVQSPAEEQALADFLRREFPGRWYFEFQEYKRQEGRISDFLLLWEGDTPVGFCHVTFEDSLYPMQRFYPYRLPRPWGQFGPLGVGRDARGKGYGAAVVDGAARYLRDEGIRGCVIDWTSLVDFYGKYGFEPYREYYILFKTL